MRGFAFIPIPLTDGLGWTGARNGQQCPQNQLLLGCKDVLGASGSLAGAVGALASTNRSPAGESLQLASPFIATAEMAVVS